MYSLSTCWNSSRHTDGREMLREIRGMGFEYAELSHGIRISLMPGVLEAVAKDEIKISSLHNFCPLPLGVNRANPNLFKFSAQDNREWNNALRYSVKTIETAARLKAQLVVLHLGDVDMHDYTHELVELVGQGKKDTPKYASLCEEAMEKRERRKEKYLDRTREMLNLLVEHAEKHGVQLGMENREALEEIPFETDFRLLLKEFPQKCIGYWHDTGHAQIKENLGFIHHTMHLESVADRLLGFHVHDVTFPGRDHCPPGTGMIDFASLKRFVKPEQIKVFEMAPGIPPEQVSKGVAALKAIWGDE